MRLLPKGSHGCLLMIILLAILSAIYSLLYCAYFRNDGPSGDPELLQSGQGATVPAVFEGFSARETGSALKK
jgi:hypothetical protein